MNDNVIILPEAPLEFRYGQVLTSPHDGLTMFGPYDGDAPSHPKNISYGVVGHEEGIARFGKFVSRIQSPVWVDPELQDRRLWPIYPGFEAIFHATLPTAGTRSVSLNADKLTEYACDADPYMRVGRITDCYMDAISRIAARDEIVDVIVCIVPDIVHRNCRMESRVSAATGERVGHRQLAERKAGQRDLFGSYDVQYYQHSLDFRRQIKARAMKHNVPIQIIRESTLNLDESSEERHLTPLSDCAWNLSVALYYKAGGRPWRLASARDGVCYVGVAYRQTGKGPGSKTACCAAQMFLDDGDGVVFMGEYGPWYSPEHKEFHLNRHAARKLLEGVLASYQRLGGKTLKEVFLHCRSSINAEEFSGFSSACPPGVSLIGIRVRHERHGVRLFREGSRPVLRGAFWPVSERRGFLWASGFKPRLGTYDGWEVPVPLCIDIQHGDGDIAQIARDIFALTKLNYNACRLGESQPVTVGFSDAVGEILVSSPRGLPASPKFKFYI